MSRRSSAPVSSEQAGRNVSPAIVRAYPLDTELDRPKRIDQYIDYFGAGEWKPSGALRDRSGVKGDGGWVDLGPIGSGDVIA